MNIAEASINKSVITWMATLTLVFGGIVAFGKLARLEDPSFTIKDHDERAVPINAQLAAYLEQVSDRHPEATWVGLNESRQGPW